MNQTLTQEKYVPCTLDTPPMKGEPLITLFNQLNNDWKLIDETYIERLF